MKFTRLILSFGILYSIPSYGNTLPGAISLESPELEKLCFNSRRLAQEYASKWRNEAIMLSHNSIEKTNLEKMGQSQPNHQVVVKGRIIIYADPCDGCIYLQGDLALRNHFKKVFEEKIHPTIPQPLPYEVKDRVGIYEDRQLLLTLPNQNKLEYVDEEKKLVLKFSARVVHPELVEYTYDYPTIGITHTQLNRIEEKEACCCYPSYMSHVFNGKKYERETKFMMHHCGKNVCTLSSKILGP